MDNKTYCTKKLKWHIHNGKIARTQNQRVFETSRYCQDAKTKRRMQDDDEICETTEMDEFGFGP